METQMKSKRCPIYPIHAGTTETIEEEKTQGRERLTITIDLILKGPVQAVDRPPEFR